MKQSKLLPFSPHKSKSNLDLNLSRFGFWANLSTFFWWSLIELANLFGILPLALRFSMYCLKSGSPRSSGNRT